MSRKEGRGVQLRPSGFLSSPNFSPTVQPSGGGGEGWELPRQTLCGGLGASRASEWEALAQTENKVCPVSGGGEEGANGQWQIFGSCFAKGSLPGQEGIDGEQWCWPQVVNWEGRGARKLSVLSLCPSF